VINSFSTKAKQLENPSFDPVEWLDKAQVEAVLELTTRHGGATPLV
jgi:hypothetical protein